MLWAEHAIWGLRVAYRQADALVVGAPVWGHSDTGDKQSPENLLLHTADGCEGWAG